MEKIAKKIIELVRKGDLRDQDQSTQIRAVEDFLIKHFDKFTLLKETTTIATDNTLPPSSPSTAEERLNEILNIHFYKPENLPYRETWIKAITEFTTQREQEAHNRAVQECIEKVGETCPSAISDWITREVISELEKLKK